MKKPILISIAIITIVSVIFVIRSDDPYALFFVAAVLLLIWSIPGVLISLVTLVPGIRKRTQNNLGVRVVALLSVMSLSMIIVFVANAALNVRADYLFAFIPPMTPRQYEDYSSNKIAEFEAKFEQHHEAIIHETWVRTIIPPRLRQPCYTNEQDVCEFVDQFPKNREGMSLDNYLGRVKLALACSLVGGVFAWYFTGRKPPQVVGGSGK